jgi:hypothetical protein
MILIIPEEPWNDILTSRDAKIKCRGFPILAFGVLY